MIWFSKLMNSSQYPFSSQNFPSDNTAGLFSRTVMVKKISNSLTYTVASSCVCTVMTIVGLRDVVKVSISALLKSFLLIMCNHVHWRSGVHNKLSFLSFKSAGFNVDASRHLFSGDEKNAALSCSFNLNTFLASSFHAASRAPCSCHSVSSWDRSSTFGFLVSNVGVMYEGICE